MRRLVILLAFILLAAGPLVYFGVGERARSSRRAGLQDLAAQKEKVAAALAENDASRPPSRRGIDLLAAETADRKTTRQNVLNGLLAYRNGPPPVEGELRTIAKAAGLDPSLLEAVMSSMPGGALGEARRHVLGRVFGALKTTPGTTLRELKVAREPSAPSHLAADERDVPIRALRIELTARGDAAALVQFAERLLATDGSGPVTDLEHLDLTPDLSVGARSPSGDLPPLVLVLVLDALVMEAK